MEPLTQEEATRQCFHNLVGFQNLISMQQHLMIGYYIVEGKVSSSQTFEETLILANYVRDLFIDITNTWGIEK